MRGPRRTNEGPAADLPLAPAVVVLHVPVVALPALEGLGRAAGDGAGDLLLLVDAGARRASLGLQAVRALRDVSGEALRGVGSVVAAGVGTGGQGLILPRALGRVSRAGQYCLKFVLESRSVEAGFLIRDRI